MRNIPRVTKNLLLINIIAYLATMVLKMSAGLDINQLFGLYYFQSPFFHAYQLITYMFMHAGFEHILFNMFALWMFGVVMERAWGGKRFLIYYLVCGIGAGLMQELAQFVQISVMGTGNAYQAVYGLTVGASGAVYGILLAFGMTYPQERIFIFPLPIPVKAKWFVLFYAGLELFLAFTQANSPVAHLAHLGGMLFGYLLIRHWEKHPFDGKPYGNARGKDFFEQMRSNWERHTHRQNAGSPRDTGTRTSNDYGAAKPQPGNQEEIDRILDKIRKSGYDSLSKEEKQTLFDKTR